MTRISIRPDSPSRIKAPESGRTGVLRACLDLLIYERIWHRRWNTGAIKAGKRFFRFGVKGDADILASPRIVRAEKFGEGYLHTTEPVFLWIETKSSDGTQLPQQEDFQKEVELQGHIYLLVNNVDILRRWIREQKVIRG